MRLAVFLLLLPAVAMSQGQGWKVDQPHKYVILNGEYIELPVEEKDTTNPGLLSALNPMNAFQNLWSSIPSFFGSGGSEPSPAGLLEIEPAVQESSPSGVFASLPSFASGIGNLFSGPGSEPTNKNSEFGTYYPHPHFIHKRSAGEGAAPTGPVRYLYRNLGQGSFLRYEIPIHTPEEIAAEHERQKKAKQSPPAHHQGPAVHNHPVEHEELRYNPKHKPLYTKPYFPKNHHDFPPETPNGKDKEVMTKDSTVTETEDPFPCPKYGLWKYDGKLCTAAHANPPWSCKPIDLATSGKLAICRNKVFQ